MGTSLREQNKKILRIGRTQTGTEEREDRSDRNQPKVLSGSIKLPQVFGYSGGTKESNRMSYNFKYCVNELALDKNLDKVESNEAIFLSVIRRPRMYSKMENYLAINKHPTLESAQDKEFTLNEEPKVKRERTSKSCPRPVVIDKPGQK